MVSFEASPSASPPIRTRSRQQLALQLSDETRTPVSPVPVHSAYADALVEAVIAQDVVAVLMALRVLCSKGLLYSRFGKTGVDAKHTLRGVSAVEVQMRRPDSAISRVILDLLLLNLDGIAKWKPSDAPLYGLGDVEEWARKALKEYQKSRGRNATVARSLLQATQDDELAVLLQAHGLAATAHGVASAPSEIRPSEAYDPLKLDPASLKLYLPYSNELVRSYGPPSCDALNCYVEHDRNVGSEAAGSPHVTDLQAAEQPRRAPKDMTFSTPANGNVDEGARRDGASSGENATLNGAAIKEEELEDGELAPDASAKSAFDVATHEFPKRALKHADQRQSQPRLSLLDSSLSNHGVRFNPYPTPSLSPSPIIPPQPLKQEHPYVPARLELQSQSWNVQAAADGAQVAFALPPSTGDNFGRSPSPGATHVPKSAHDLVFSAPPPAPTLKRRASPTPPPLDWAPPAPKRRRTVHPWRRKSVKWATVDRVVVGTGAGHVGEEDLYQEPEDTVAQAYGRRIFAARTATTPITTAVPLQQEPVVPQPPYTETSEPPAQAESGGTLFPLPLFAPPPLAPPPKTPATSSSLPASWTAWYDCL
ncbi:hypothetical protein JCM10908_001425 [Rhodotorula pacifica]|uniref:uncharacterized protein n=1 Tax=Rhodotorula pacifica TaxID=1495444 RepID=UPI00317CD249